MKVLKFGGSSVGSVESIKAVCQIIKDKINNKETVAIVLSAFQGVTDLLILMGVCASKGDITYEKHYDNLVNKCNLIITGLFNKQSKNILKSVNKKLDEIKELLHGIYLIKELSAKTSDKLLSYGERISNFVIAEYLKKLEIEAEYINATNIIKTDSNFGSAKVNFDKTNKLINDLFKNNNTVKVITGFIGSNDNNEPTTLGRGGSDYTAAIIGAAINANEIEIWTDVDGVLTADPRKVKESFSIDCLSYEEAMELSHFGAKVIYPPTMQPATAKNIPIRIKNTFNPTFKGTLIHTSSKKGNNKITGISSIDEVALIRVEGPGMVGVAGIAKRLFGTLASAGINIILITQASSEHSICFAVLPKFANDAKSLIEKEFYYEIKDGLVNDVIIENDLSIIAVVGENMRQTAGIAGNLFSSLGESKINIIAIAQGSSELNISIVISKNDLVKALNLIHSKFFFNNISIVNLFIAGIGNVGNKFIELLFNQQKNLLLENNIKINLIGVANSNKMLLCTEGINEDDLRNNFNIRSKKYSDNQFINTIINLHFENKIFVDCTSGKQTANEYLRLLQNAVYIVTANKTANSSNYSYYSKLKLASNKGKTYKYSATVGAGLPILSTIEKLIEMRDEIEEIEAQLSGTIGFLFNTLSKQVPFSKAVKIAKELGFTEPDPRDDLSGFDILRKAVIILRAMGKDIELEQIEKEELLSKEMIEAKDVKEFFKVLKNYDPVFEEKRLDAEKDNCRLKYLFSYKNGKAKIGLLKVNSNSPFFNLKHTDNMIVIKSKYYKNPLIISGAGAGAEVTAAAVFADLLTIIKDNLVIYEK